MIDIELYLTRLESLARGLGVFDRVNLHDEVVSPPSTGLTCSIWNQEARPQPGESGLAATTYRVEMFMRLYHVLRPENPDVIDIKMVKAASSIMGAISGGFTLGGNVKYVDLLGRGGQPLSYQAGYYEDPDTDINYRVITVTVPLIVNDVFEQVR